MGGEGNIVNEPNSGQEQKLWPYINRQMHNSSLLPCLPTSMKPEEIKMPPKTIWGQIKDMTKW